LATSSLWSKSIIKDWSKHILTFVCLGIPWTLDVISAAIAHQHGSGQTFEARLALDILNLLTVSILTIIFHHNFPCYSGSCDFPGFDLQGHSVQEAGDQVWPWLSAELQLQHENTGINEPEKV
jgi:hypothetical protein